jgi:hypothetical protein
MYLHWTYKNNSKLTVISLHILGIKKKKPSAEKSASMELGPFVIP